MSYCTAYGGVVRIIFISGSFDSDLLHHSTQLNPYISSFVLYNHYGGPDVVLVVVFSELAYRAQGHDHAAVECKIPS